MSSVKSIQELPSWDFKKDCVLISGGVRGIGAGSVRLFASAGARVIFGDQDRSGGEQLEEELVQKGLKVWFVETDFTKEGAWKPLHEKAKSLGEQISLVISNVGASKSVLLEEASVEDFDWAMQLNLRSAWLAAREFTKELAEVKGSSLILTGSIMANAGSRGSGLYVTAKAALSGLLKALTVELSPRGIRVNMVVPGYIAIDPPDFYRSRIPQALWREFHETFSSQYLEDNPPVQPFSWWGVPQDIAQTIAFLHSPAARYITGTEIRVDGGLLCQSPIRPHTGNSSWKWTKNMEEWLNEKKGE